MDAPAEQDWSPVILAPLLVALALWSIPATIQAGDAGEFATVMLTGGVPHPSGYPLMRALGLLSRLLWAAGLPPASAAAIPPAMCGVGAWLLVQRCGARLGRPWISACVVLLAAASPLAVVHVNDSEVWGPHLLLSALFCRLALHERPRPLLLGASLGLAFSQHLTAIWLIPLAVASALPLRGSEAYLRKLLRNGGLGLLGSALGLLPYLSLGLGRGGAWRWGAVETPAGLLHHVLRRDYGTFRLSLHEEEVAASDTLRRALGSVAEVFSAGTTSAPIAGALLLGFALLMAWVWVRRTAPACPRWRTELAPGWLLATLGSALIFPLIQNIDPTLAFGAWILERFDLLTLALLSVPLSLGLGELGERIVTQRPALERVVPAGAGLIALVSLLAQLGAVLEQGRPAEGRGVELAARDLVETPSPQLRDPPAELGPIRAIVFGTDDHRSFPVTYVQAVHGAGAHTLYIDASLLAHPWYRAQLRRRLPGLPDVDKPLRLVGAIWQDPALAGLPIYAANVFSAPLARQARVPEGLLWRLVPPPQLPLAHAAAEWTPQALLERHLSACARMRARPEHFEARPRDPWSSDLAFAYVEKARALARGFAAEGRQEAVEAIAACLAEHTGVDL